MVVITRVMVPETQCKRDTKGGKRVKGCLCEGFYHCSIPSTLFISSFSIAYLDNRHLFLGSCLLPSPLSLRGLWQRRRRRGVVIASAGETNDPGLQSQLQLQLQWFGDGMGRRRKRGCSIILYIFLEIISVVMVSRLEGEWLGWAVVYKGYLYIVTV